MTSTTDASRKAVEKMYAAGISGDIEGMMTLLAEDVVVHEPPFLPYGGDHHGHAGFTELFASINEYLDMAQVKVDRIIADGPWVIAVMRIPDRVTGKDVILSDELLVHDGTITELRIYFHDAQSLVPADRD